MQTHPKYGFTLGFKSKKIPSMDVTAGSNIELKLQDWFLQLVKYFLELWPLGIDEKAMPH